jgi:hypothetical protein
MNARKSLVTIHNSDQEFSLHPEAFVFFDEKTGTQRFDVKVNPKFGGSQGGRQCWRWAGKPDLFGKKIPRWTPAEKSIPTAQ